MKRLIAAALMLMMIFTLVACGGGEKSDDAAKVKAYVEEHEDELISGLEASFTQTSGMSCNSSIEVDGCGFIISIKIDGLDDIADDLKDQMQTAYNSLESTFDGALKDMQKEIPELDYFTIRVCEEDGDLLATINAD